MSEVKEMRSGSETSDPSDASATKVRKKQGWIRRLVGYMAPPSELGLKWDPNLFGV